MDAGKAYGMHTTQAGDQIGSRRVNFGSRRMTSQRAMGPPMDNVNQNAHLAEIFNPTGLPPGASRASQMGSKAYLRTNEDELSPSRRYAMEAARAAATQP